MESFGLNRKNTSIVIFHTCFVRNLSDDADCTKYLPLDPETRDLYVRCNDGVIFW